MENNTTNESEKRITRIFHSIKDAFKFAWANSDKKPKVRSTTGTDIHTVSYLNAFNSES